MRRPVIPTARLQDGCSARPGPPGTLRSMIVRLVTATVRTDRAGSFNALMRAAVPILREHPGLVYVKLARRDRGRRRGGAALRGVAEYRRALRVDRAEIWRSREFIPGAEELVTDVPGVHYEALDIDPPFDY